MPKRHHRSAAFFGCSSDRSSALTGLTAKASHSFRRMSWEKDCHCWKFTSLDSRCSFRFRGWLADWLVNILVYLMYLSNVSNVSTVSNHFNAKTRTTISTTKQLDACNPQSALWCYRRIDPHITRMGMVFPHVSTLIIWVPFVYLLLVGWVALNFMCFV